MSNNTMLYKHILGGTFVFPPDWLEVDLDKALESPYVGVIEMRNGYKYNVPHFFFHSKKPIQELSDYTELSLFEKCCKLSDEFAEGYRHEVRAVTDPVTGKLLNEDEFKEGTLAAIFVVQAEDAVTDHPYGAMILKEYI